MIRRKRQIREIPFSFDSFLDVVANVVGIIIRLILVVWVGARSYSSLNHHTPAPGPESSMPASSAPAPEDPLQHVLDQHQLDLVKAQNQLIEELRKLQAVRGSNKLLQGQLMSLVSDRTEVDRAQTSLQQKVTEQKNVMQSASLSLDELRQRQDLLKNDLKTLEAAPLPKHVLRYRTPVSQPVNSEELLFECRGQRVSFIDIAALMAEVRHGIDNKGQLLKTRWQASDVTGPVGSFRLRYTVERERTLVESLAPQNPPENSVGFRYGLSDWVVEPITENRGESLSIALGQGSDFRRITDFLDPHQAVVTFWVYPDSFAIFRHLRDYLYERDVMVAGRPLPEGIPISCSKQGSISRGQ